MESRDFFRAVHDYLMRNDPSIERITIVFDGRGCGDPVCVPGHIIVASSFRPYMFFDPTLWEPKPGAGARPSPIRGLMTLEADKHYENPEDAYPFLRTQLEPIGAGDIDWPAHQWPDFPRFKNDVWIYAPD
jgi:hypothetical protein